MARAKSRVQFSSSLEQPTQPMSSSPVVAEESGWVAAIPADACQEIASQTPNPVAAVKRKPGRPKGMVGRWRECSTP